jgi:hypothetical protein
VSAEEFAGMLHTEKVRRTATYLIDRNGRTIPIQWKLNLVPFRQKSIETQHQLLVAVEEIGHRANDTRCVDLLRLKILHNIEELVIDMRTVAELHLHLIQVLKRILNTELSHYGLLG